MSDNLITLLGGLLVAAPGIASLIFQLLKLTAEKKKMKSETTKTDAEAAGEIGDAWKDLLEPYRVEVANLNKRITQQQRKIEDLESRVKLFEEVLSGAHRLYSQLKDNKIDPVWKPPDRREKLAEEKEG